MDNITTKEGAVPKLSNLVSRGHTFLTKENIPPKLIEMWLGQVRFHLRHIYGPNSEVEDSWTIVLGDITKDRAREQLRLRLARLDLLLSILKDSVSRSLGGEGGQRVFIGHGRSPVWRELKDFLHDRLALQWEEFNRESTPGIATTERLQHMLQVSTFAFLVMTAEDDHADQTRHARANVVHEVGLFQGRLGPRRAIILLEEGCQQFSNVHGLTHIPFPPGRVSAAFEEIRRVLEREGVAETLPLTH